MYLPEAVARRALSEVPIDSSCQPVDLACATDSDESELVVRTKLIRDKETAAACIAEATAHAILRAIGLPVAEAYAVVVGAEFAEDLSRQFGFESPVISGRHWGTELIERCAEVIITEEHYPLLRNPGQVFLIYLADVLLGYADRQTIGNVLLLPVFGGKRVDLVAIDQSHCFFGPAAMCNPAEMWSKRNESVAQPFAGLEQLMIREGPALVEASRDRFVNERASILGAVGAAPDEWYDRAGVNPDDLGRLIEYRLEHIEELGRLEWWRGVAAAAGGDNVILF